MKKGLVIVLTVLLLVGVVGAVAAASINGDYKGYPIVKVLVSGQEYKGEVPAINFNGTTMVPVRFVAEALGQQVNWDGSTWTVNIGDSTVASGQASQEQKLTDAGGGFYYKNVSFKSTFNMMEAIGEMRNESGKSYTLVNFIISVYSASGQLLGTGYINVSNFNSGATKTFNGIVDADVTEQFKYSIQFENAI